MTLFDSPHYNVEVIGKVATIINGGRALWGAAVTTNTPTGSVCPVCHVAKKSAKPGDTWLFWPLVGMVCIPCSRTVHDATPWEPLTFWADGAVKDCLTRRGLNEATR